MILGKLEAIDGHRSFASIRQVSRSWQAALHRYPARAVLRNPQPQRLQNVCHALASMISLNISYSDLDVNLGPLVALTQLTSLTVTGEGITSRLRRFMPPATGELDLSCLPITLSRLSLTDIGVEPAKFHNIQCTAVTSLSWNSTESTVAFPEGDFLLVLFCLPRLKVRRLSCPF